MGGVSDADRLAMRRRPEGHPVMYQSWRNLLMLHWRLDPAAIQQQLPAGLTVDTYDGSAWVGVVPFLMRNIRPRWLPAVPHLSYFLELNLRTYAFNDQGIPGVWFFSLNANRRLAVFLARRWFHLPYHFCRMSAALEDEGWTDYRTHRHGTPTEQTCHYHYRPQGPSYVADPGSLEFFLAERYVLFAELPGGQLAHGRVHHRPYPLQPAEVEHHDRHLFAMDALPVPEQPFEHALYTCGVDVEVFPLTTSGR